MDLFEYQARDLFEAHGVPVFAGAVATTQENLLICGSGARRGGAVSGIASHNAAQAVLEQIG